MDEQTRAALPAWVQVIAGHVTDMQRLLDRKPFNSYVAMLEQEPEDNSRRAAFCKVACTDVPRLIEAAAGMAEALEFALEDAGNCSERPCLTCSQSDCLCNVAALALAKYRGEGNS